MPDVRVALQEAIADRYRLERELGHGGMGIVYPAQDLRYDRAVAVKVLRPELACVVGPVRFAREVRITAHLQHPNILQMIEAGDSAGIPYYVTPFVEGESLADRLRGERQLPIPDALQIANDVADALSFAHAHGVVHRDIKPDNILLAGGRAVVADFGIAGALDEAGGERLTSTGLVLGTPHYMSPHQNRRRGCGALTSRRAPKCCVISSTRTSCVAPISRCTRGPPTARRVCPRFTSAASGAGSPPAARVTALPQARPARAASRPAGACRRAPRARFVPLRAVGAGHRCPAPVRRRNPQSRRRA